MLVARAPELPCGLTLCRVLIIEKRGRGKGLEWVEEVVEIWG
jgi:hypothetical protein